MKEKKNISIATKKKLLVAANNYFLHQTINY